MNYDTIQQSFCFSMIKFPILHPHYPVLPIILHGIYKQEILLDDCDSAMWAAEMTPSLYMYYCIVICVTRDHAKSWLPAHKFYTCVIVTIFKYHRTTAIISVFWTYRWWYTREGNLTIPDNNVHGANLGPTWVLSAQDGPFVGPMDHATGMGLPPIRLYVFLAKRCSRLYRTPRSDINLIYITIVSSDIS